MKTLKIGTGRYEYRGYSILKDRGEWKAKTWSDEKRRNVIVERGDTLSECKAKIDARLCRNSRRQRGWDSFWQV